MIDKLLEVDQVKQMAIAIGLTTTAFLVIGSVVEATTSFIKQLGRCYYDAKQVLREMCAADAAHADQFGGRPRPAIRVSSARVAADNGLPCGDDERAELKS